jgi:hypothetical protein
MLNSLFAGLVAVSDDDSSSASWSGSWSDATTNAPGQRRHGSHDHQHLIRARSSPAHLKVIP